MSPTRSAKALRRMTAYLAVFVAALVGIYALVGFVLAPYLIQRMAPAAVTEHLQRDLELHHVGFNPFTLRLTLQGLILRERQGATLASIAEATIDLDAGPLLEREIWLSELQLIGPWVNLEIAADGQLNLARLIADAGGDEEATAALPPAPAAEPWYLMLEKVDIRNGVLHVSDLSRPTPAEVDILPIDLQAQRLSTRPDGEGGQSLTLGFGDGSRLSVQGELVLNPLSATGRLRVEDYSPRLTWRFLQDEFDLEQPAGRLNGRADYDFGYADGKARLRVSDLQLALSDLRLQRRAAARPLLELQTLVLEDGEFDLDGNRFKVGRLGASTGVVRAIRDQTLLDWAGIARGTAVEQKPADETGAAPFSVTLDAVEVAGVAVQFEDRDQASPVRIGTEDLRLRLALLAQRTKDGTEVRLDDLRADLKMLSLTQADAQEPLLTLDHTVLEGGMVDLAGTRVALNDLQVDGGRVIVERTADGQLNWQQVWTSPSKPSAEAEPNPWRVALQRFRVAGFGAVITDRGAPAPVTLNVTPIALQVTDITHPPEAPLKFELDAALQEGGKLAASGQVDLAGPSVVADLDLSDITLLPLQTYLTEFARVSLDSGRAGLRGRLDFAQEGDGGLRFAGTARVDDLAVTESVGGATLLGWRALQAEELAIAPGRLDIKELLLDRAEGKFIINQDTTTNWQDVLKSSPTEAAPSESPEQAQDFLAQVQRISIRDAALNFGDLSLTPQFRSNIHGLKGSIAGISTAKGARASVELEGGVDEFGTATIQGELQPTAPREFVDILMVFRNIDLSHLAPYGAKFAGYKIDSGKLSLDLGYMVQNAQLQGNNQIVIDKLTLGEKVDSPDAIDAPLELAIALLEDANGRIDIGLPVAGDLDDPQFSYGQIVWKALGNLITKAISAPFRVLAAALGVEGEKLDTIVFAPGAADLLPPEREKLGTVVKILADRPKLALQIQGGYSLAEDGAALRTLAVNRAVLQKQGIKLAPGEAPGPVSLTDGDTQKAVEKLFDERLGAEALAREKQALKAMPPDERRAALVERLYDQLREKEPLATTVLPQLAQDRAKAIAVQLEQQLPAGRMTLLEPAAAEQVSPQGVASRLNLTAAP